MPDLPGTFVVQLIANDGFLNSLPATTEIVAVSQQTSLITQIQERQGVIATLPDDGFKFKGARAIMAIELNAVLLSLETHDYRATLVVLDVAVTTAALFVHCPLEFFSDCRLRAFRRSGIHVFTSS